MSDGGDVTGPPVAVSSGGRIEGGPEEELADDGELGDFGEFVGRRNEREAEEKGEQQRVSIGLARSW